MSLLLALLTPPVATPTYVAPVAPEHLARRVAQQPPALVFVPAPIAVAVPFFGVVAPERLSRPRREQPDSLSSPLRDRKAPAAAAFAPERVIRPWPQQPDSFVVALRERTATFFDAIGPPRLDARPRFVPGESFSVPRDRTLPFAESYGPSRFDRLRPQQPDNAPPIFIAPAAQTLDWTVVAPERLDRPRPQQPDSFVAPRPERTSPLATVVAPDRLTRPAAQQPDTAAPIRERTAPAAAAFYPDRITRPVPQQPDTAAPIRERKLPFFDVVAPERLDRPGVRQAQGLAFAFVVPEDVVPYAEVHHDDRLVRPRPQQPDSFVAPRPERTSPLATVVAPDRLTRPAAQQPDTAAPIRERTAPAAAAFYPERFDRPGTQQPELALVLPERTATFFDVVAPERLDRPSVPAGAQLAFVFVEPEDAVPYAEVHYDERLDRPRAQQPDTAAPIVERASPAADAFYPDRLDRPRPQQPEPSEPIVERTSPFFEAIYPERFAAPRRTDGTFAWLFAAAPPVVVPTFFDAIYPIRLDQRTSVDGSFVWPSVVPPPTPPTPPTPPAPPPSHPTYGPSFGYPSGISGGPGPYQLVDPDCDPDELDPASPDYCPPEKATDADFDALEAKARRSLRRAARKLHPDVGGDAETFSDLTAAYDDARRLATAAKARRPLLTETADLDEQWASFLRAEQRSTESLKQAFAKNVRRPTLTLPAPTEADAEWQAFLLNEEKAAEKRRRQEARRQRQEAAQQQLRELAEENRLSKKQIADLREELEATRLQMSEPIHVGQAPIRIFFSAPAPLAAATKKEWPWWAKGALIGITFGLVVIAGQLVLRRLRRREIEKNAPTPSPDIRRTRTPPHGPATGPAAAGRAISHGIRRRRRRGGPGR